MTANNLNNWFNIYFTSDSKIEYNTAFVLSLLIKYFIQRMFFNNIIYHRNNLYAYEYKSQNYINIVIISYKFYLFHFLILIIINIIYIILYTYVYKVVSKQRTYKNIQRHSQRCTLQKVEPFLSKKKSSVLKLQVIVIIIFKFINANQL